MSRVATLRTCTGPSWPCTACEAQAEQGIAIRVFNPSLDADGWVSTHSVAQIRHPDGPFIVDSFLAALARRELALHSMHNVVRPAGRGGTHHRSRRRRGQAEVVIKPRSIASIPRSSARSSRSARDAHGRARGGRRLSGDARARGSAIEGIDGAASASMQTSRKGARSCSGCSTTTSRSSATANS